MHVSQISVVQYCLFMPSIQMDISICIDIWHLLVWDLLFLKLNFMSLRFSMLLHTAAVYSLLKQVYLLYEIVHLVIIYLSMLLLMDMFFSTFCYHKQCCLKHICTYLQMHVCKISRGGYIYPIKIQFTDIFDSHLYVKSFKVAIEISLQRYLERSNSLVIFFLMNQNEQITYS